MVNWFKNMKISRKFILGFGLAILLSIVLAVLGIYNSSNIDGDYSYILEYPQKRMDSLAEVKLNTAKMRRCTTQYVVFSGNNEKMKEVHDELETIYSLIVSSLNTYEKSLNSDMRRDAEAKSNALKQVAELRELTSKYKKDIADAGYDMSYAGNTTEATTFLSSSSTVILQIYDVADKMWKDASNYVESLSAASTESSNSAIMMLIILSIVAVVASIGIAYVTAISITRPVKRLVAITEDVAAGQLNVNTITESKDEIGTLVKNFYVVINVVKTLVDDLSHMGHEQNAGDIDVYVDEAKYKGSYRELAVETNAMVKGHVDVILEYLGKTTEVLDGDFSVTMRKLPGKKVVMNEALETLKSIIGSISGEINGMIKNISEGKTDEKINASKYKGEWGGLMTGLNQVLQEYNTPIDETLAVLQQMAKGNFRDSVKGVYKGNFNVLKTSVNDMITNISAYITEISEVLNQLADNNLDQGISRDYVGEFAAIKNAINNIIDKFNNVIGEITSATEQVSAGARQISESSMSLAQGATEQASAVEELTATVMSVNEKTQLNAENAKRAAGLSGDLRGHAVEGNTQMKNMLASMKEINEASSSISKIITIIKDIAFQTNLLALNASIEAAHAGVHGAGFSVVAEEVRSLAGKSEEAANDTTRLIETSIQRVNEGTSIAEKTDQALERIVSGVSEVSEIVSGISDASNEQALAISQINDGVGQIAQVVQNNSATSEESASAAQELSSQSEMLKSMVQVFHLK